MDDAMDRPQGLELARREFLLLGGKVAAALTTAGVLGCATPASAQDPPAPGPHDAPAGGAGPLRYTARDYAHLRGLRAITDEQVEVHLQLYRGYVTRTNALLDALDAERAAGAPDAAHQELRRRLGFEWDGMRLHELYFDNLAKDAAPLAADAPFAKAVTATWGSVDAWRAELLSTAKLPGVGWVVTWKDGASGALWNGWIDDHERGHPAGATPLLVIDIWEHAWSVYRRPTERAKYLDDVLANVAWDVVGRRLG
jgi:Fe-Mn family superoxide dismutase